MIYVCINNAQGPTKPWPDQSYTACYGPDLRFNVDRDLDDGNSDVNIQGYNLERVITFKYLGATLAENGDLDAEMTHSIQSGWKNWKRISGILCDRRISLRVKGKVYKTVVRPAMMYGAETWAVKKAHEKKLDVAEMRVLRWMSGVTKMDRIRNERIRGTTKVGEISKKVQESRLKWACFEKRIRIRREESDGDWRCRGKEGEEDQSGGGWIAPGTTCQRGDCQRRTRKTGLDGGVSQDTSTPHKSGKR